MKYKTTRKAVKEMGMPIYKVGYCNLANLLHFEYPFAYSTRAEGWACDYYIIGNVVISTGYDPIGRKTDWNLCCEYDKKALAILQNYKLNLEEMKSKVTALLEEFVGKIS